MDVEVSEGGVAQQEMFPDSGDAQTSTPPADSGVSDVANELGIDEDTAKMFADNDPQFRERLIAKPQDGQTDSNGGDDHGAGGETSGENSATADEQKGGSPSTDDKDSGENDRALEFKDDVIPGLKGEVLAKLPKEAQEAVADFYGAVEERAKKVEASEAAMNLLRRDPYLKSRIEAIETGTQAQIRGLTPKDEEAIAENVTKHLAEKLAIEDADAAEVVAAFKDGIMGSVQSIAQQMAQDYAAQLLQGQEAVREIAEVNRQGDAILLGLSDFDKSLAVKEKDLSKFYVRQQDGKTVFNEKHPEIEAFKNGIGKFVEWASERGITYRQVVKMGAKAFYAAAAADLNRPVAFNTKERDAKMVGNAVKEKLKPFLKTDGGTLNVGGGNAAQGGGAEPKIIHGFNAVKLVEDGAYREEMYLKHALDADMIDKLDAAASVGRDIIEKQSKTRR